MATWTRGPRALERRECPEWYLWQDGAAVVRGAVSTQKLECVQPGEPGWAGQVGTQAGGWRERTGLGLSINITAHLSLSFLHL